jgi:hypothetical protein
LSKVRVWAVVGAMLLSAVAAYAQFDFGFRGDSNMAPMRPPALRKDRAFSFCRLLYTSVRREPSGGGWRTDYPYGEINLMIRLSELTKTPVPFERAREPMHYVVRLTDDALFECPFTMASDVGTIGLSPAEAEQLRLYLLKGGFLWVDDFWGTLAWQQWTRELSKVLPPSEYPIEDVHSPTQSSAVSSSFPASRRSPTSGSGAARAVARRPSGVTTAAKRTSARFAIRMAASWWS